MRNRLFVRLLNPKFTQTRTTIMICNKHPHRSKWSIKSVSKQIRRVSLFTMLVVPGAIFLSATQAFANVNAEGGTLTLELSPDITVPVADAPGASGIGSVTVDVETGAISGSVTVNGTTGQPTAAHVHQGGVGEAGPIVVGMEGNEDGSVWTISPGSALDAPAIEAFMEGNLYINVHTAANAPGELRVQLVDTNPITLSMLELDPESTVPPANAPGASGTGSITVDTVSGAISGSVTVFGTTGQPTAAHVHQGGVGEAGPIVVGMESSEDGTVWTIPTGSALDADGVQAFIEGNLYINVHTEANAPGELRVQLVDGNSITLSMLELDPDSTVPPANAPGASGTGSVTVNTVSGAISGSITVSGTTGQPTVAHVHLGGVGEAGPIVIGLDGNSDGSVWTIPAGSVLDAASIQAFIEGNLYINVHTEANAPGELRVQLVDGNSITLSMLELDPESTVPPANAPGASGTGSITVNTVSGAISGSVTVTGTTGEPTAAHVHRGGVGEAGPIVVGMEANEDGSVWTIPAGSTLDTVGIQDFIDGNLYINVHTVANAPGELRVQLVDGIGDDLGLSGQVYSASALELFWVRQPSDIVAYQISGSNGTSVTVDGTSLFINNLASSTTFTFTVTALDVNGSESVSETIELTTLAGDSASVAVENLRGEVYSSSAVEIFWDVSNAPADVSFNVFRDGELVATTDGRSFFDEGLASGTEFTYSVEPFIGGVSATIALFTNGGATGGGAGLGLNGIVYSSSALEIFWQRIDAAVSYRIERDGQTIDERDGLSLFDTGLSFGTNFTYSVTALSADGSEIAVETIGLTTQQ